MAESKWIGDDFVKRFFRFGGGISDELGKTLGTDNNESIDKAIANMDNIIGVANSTAEANRKLYNDYYGQMQGMYGDNAAKYGDAVARLADAIDQYGNSGDFEYGGSVDQFLDPARNQRVSAAMSAINNAAASGGSRFSSGYLEKLASKQQAMASEEWRAAYDRMMRDRSQQMAEWQTRQDKLGQNVNNMGTMANLYGNDRKQLSDAIGNYYSNLANQNNADLEVYSDVSQKKAELDAARKGGVGSVLGGLGSVVSAIFG